MKKPRFDDLPALPRDDDGPVFREPWEAQAFAMTLKLHQAGCFTWREWAERLGAEIAAAGEPDLGNHYYRHWLSALEKIVIEKQLLPAADLRRRKQQWEQAARETAQGQAIKLGRDLAAEKPFDQIIQG